MSFERRTQCRLDVHDDNYKKMVKTKNKLISFALLSSNLQPYQKKEARSEEIKEEHDWTSAVETASTEQKVGKWC